MNEIADLMIDDRITNVIYLLECYFVIAKVRAIFDQNVKLFGFPGAGWTDISHKKLRNHQTKDPENKVNDRHQWN